MPNSFFRSSILDNIELLQSTASNHSFPTHFHDTFCISLIKNGIFNENNVTAISGSILISKPYEIHDNIVEPDNFYCATTIYVNEHVLTNLTQQTPNFSSKVITDDTLTKQFLKTEYNFLNKNLENDISVFLQSLINKYATKSVEIIYPKIEAITQLEHYIELNFMNKIKLNILAKIAGLSEYKLIRYFKKHKGLTPFEFILIKRIEYAKVLLQSNISIVSIALDTGFYDQSIFSNYFKKYTGLTPAQYKKSCNILQD